MGIDNAIFGCSPAAFSTTFGFFFTTTPFNKDLTSFLTAFGGILVAGGAGRDVFEPDDSAATTAALFDA